MTADWQNLTIGELHPLMRKKEISPVELTREILERIAALDGKLHCYVTVDQQGALAQAREAEKRWADGQATPLTGIPLAIKDLIATRGLRTTCASRSLENYLPPYDATVMEKLRQAGAVILGKVNMDEFAMGSSTENSAFGATLNPWRPDRIPGGSSGGSAAAVAADLCLASLGSDTGGSIRQPASHCGVVGLKPTYGRVSRFGLVAYASSLDQIGPLGKDVTDCALLLEIIAGYDPKDSTSAPVPVPDYVPALKEDIRGLKIAVPREYFLPGMQPEVEQAVRAALATYTALGADLVEVSLPHTEYAVAVYYLIATAEASSNLARYDGVKYGYRNPEATELMDMYYTTRAQGLGAEVRRRIMLGTYALSAGYYEAYYQKASQVRTLIRRDFEEVFRTCQVVATPVAPTTAFRLGEKTDDPLTMYLSDIFTISANLAGIPGISLPCGLDSLGLPIGLQLLARPFDEATLLRAAYAFEQATDFHRLKPTGLKGI
ncbi:MAG: Asp-tRNA(Asn)/Glu-tRNA(Gln) amidotransferase subunit GatA [Deltaproteobacteria bacterium]|nr:Asp-tRNA(Asn)/Glu-tRNA(Gln) amidotransferase subunit GatA [Deltaproteobacteria bacterium]